MGWMFSPSWDRKALIKHLLEDQGPQYKAIAHTCTGNNLWAVFEKTLGNESPYRFIVLFLMQNGGAGHGWGYKDISEDMGPYEKNCPLKYLDLALPTKPNSYSEEWRNNVRAFWTAKKDARNAAAKLNRGDEIKSEMSGKTFIFIRNHSATFVLAEDETGKLYRVRKTDICWPVFRPQESAAI